MSNHHESALRIAELLEQLGSDDAYGSRRLQIANLYVSLGDNERAATWFLEAASFAMKCDHGDFALMSAKSALAIKPNDAAIRAIVEDYRRRFELSPSTFKLPGSFQKKS